MKKVTGWSLKVEWDNGEIENITDLESFMPSNLIQDIDDSLTDLEKSKWPRYVNIATEEKLKRRIMLVQNVCVNMTQVLH